VRRDIEKFGEEHSNGSERNVDKWNDKKSVKVIESVRARNGRALVPSHQASTTSSKQADKH